MTGFLLILAMGLVAWYAWPAATTFPVRVWTIVFAVFLAPFSWPWLVARGHRARRDLAKLKRTQADAEAQQTHLDNVEWWKREYLMAEQAGDIQRRELAAQVLASLGYIAFGSPRNRGFTETS